MTERGGGECGEPHREAQDEVVERRLAAAFVLGFGPVGLRVARCEIGSNSWPRKVFSPITVLQDAV